MTTHECEHDAAIYDLLAEIDALRAERDEAHASYRFMVERAADERLDGYRELGTRAAAAENERDAALASLATARAEGRAEAVKEVVDVLDDLLFETLHYTEESEAAEALKKLLDRTDWPSEERARRGWALMVMRRSLRALAASEAAR